MAVWWWGRGITLASAPAMNMELCDRGGAATANEQARSDGRLVKGDGCEEQGGGWAGTGGRKQLRAALISPLKGGSGKRW